MTILRLKRTRRSSTTAACAGGPPWVVLDRSLNVIATNKRPTSCTDNNATIAKQAPPPQEELLMHLPENKHGTLIASSYFSDL